MAGQPPAETDSNREITDRLDKILAELKAMRKDGAAMAARLAEYEPLIEKAAALVNSPAAKVAARMRRGIYGS